MYYFKIEYTILNLELQILTMLDTKSYMLDFTFPVCMNQKQIQRCYVTKILNLAESATNDYIIISQSQQ